MTIMELKIQAEKLIKKYQDMFETHTEHQTEYAKCRLLYEARDLTMHINNLLFIVHILDNSGFNERGIKSSKQIYEKAQNYFDRFTQDIVVREKYWEKKE